MPVFRVTYDIVAPDKASAEKHAKFVDKPNAYFKVSKVRGPLGKRKKWNIYRNGELYAKTNTSKKNAEALATTCRASCKVYNLPFVFTVMEV